MLGVPAVELTTARRRQPARCSIRQASRAALSFSTRTISGPPIRSSRLMRMTRWPFSMQVSISETGGAPDTTTVASAR